MKDPGYLWNPPVPEGPWGLVLKAPRLLYHPTLDWRIIKKKEIRTLSPGSPDGVGLYFRPRGYLAHKKTTPPPAPSQAPRHKPAVGS